MRRLVQVVCIENGSSLFFLKFIIKINMCTCVYIENVIRKGQYEIWMHQSETNRMGFLHCYWYLSIRYSLGRLPYLITILFYQNWRLKWNCMNIFQALCLPVISNNFDSFYKTTVTLVIITGFDTRHPLLKSQSGSAVKMLLQKGICRNHINVNSFS